MIPAAALAIQGTSAGANTTPVSNLWNEVAPGIWEPKNEDHFSDNVKQHLDDDLRGKGVVLNREAQIRSARRCPGRPTNRG